MSECVTPQLHCDSANQIPIDADNKNNVATTIEAPINANTCSLSSSDSSDVLSKGISSVLASVLRDFDCRAENTARSQDLVSFAIDRLNRKLDQLLEDAPVPFIMQQAAKISGVRKRVSSLNLLLKSIQQRVDNIDRMLFVELQPEKTVNNSSGEH